ncbi:hypothetical protein [Vagococcus sp. WN89Y]|uniref:hypothetical protein n=1 Tax=Vagococcus sp. WN89Y TaxID=3457258 RepID=UPI003FCC3464
MKPHVFIIAMLTGMFVTYVVLWFIYIDDGIELAPAMVVFLSLFVGAMVQQLIRFLLSKRIRSK